MRNYGLVLALSAALCVGVGRANAQTIVYTEEALANGSIGANNFSDADVLITFTGDISNVTSGGGLSFNSVGTTTVQVAGVGSGTFIGATDVFDNSYGAAGISGNGGTDILDTQDPAFQTYGLTTAIGPITDNPLFNPEVDFQTTAGTFTLYGIESNSTFTATLNPTSNTPEPGAYALIGSLGLTGLGFLRRRNVSRKA